MALYSNKKGIKEAKEAAGAQQYAAAKAMETTAAQTARMQAEEQSKLAVLGLLGKPVTFGSNVFSQTINNQNNIDNPQSIYDESGYGLSQPDQSLKQLMVNTNKKGLLGTPRQGILDPESYAKTIAGTVPFQIQSQRVSEANQLLNQEGPAWDMLKNSVLGVINEGAAIQLRDDLRLLRNQAAKGGAARRQALDNANEILVQERAMRTRVHETWQANLALFDAVRVNSDRVAAGTSTFMEGLPLVNENYRNAMLKASDIQNTSSQLAAQSALQAYETKMTQQPVNFGTKLAEGLIGVVASAIPYVGAVLGPAVQEAGSGGGYTPIPQAGQAAPQTGGGGNAFSNVLGGLFGGQGSSNPGGALDSTLGGLGSLSGSEYLSSFSFGT